MEKPEQTFWSIQQRNVCLSFSHKSLRKQEDHKIHSKEAFLVGQGILNRKTTWKTMRIRYSVEAAGPLHYTKFLYK